MQPIVFKTLDEFEEFGHKLAQELTPGDIVLLKGDLGAGKTTLVRSISEKLGTHDLVSSPSFAIINLYHGGKMPIAHFDLYRLSQESDMENIGASDYLNGHNLVFVEWPEHGGDFFNDPDIIIDIGIIDHGDARTIKLTRKNQ
ncbi:MAG: tRNA (adenosine(37)-N6)-threonylcarbamoyltransferase complex ATPase subunit type 1 TsaE [Spirochaetes bacterium]|nr:tRNA (adenosine(37)-N6)-threonylcarbamoyltransferase complex ATPase subunit type 1 TsaE [Spirochaetota bacterium]